MFQRNYFIFTNTLMQNTVDIFSTVDCSFCYNHRQYLQQPNIWKTMSKAKKISKTKLHQNVRKKCQIQLRKPANCKDKQYVVKQNRFSLRFSFDGCTNTPLSTPEEDPKIQKVRPVSFTSFVIYLLQKIYSFRFQHQPHFTAYLSFLF